MGWFSRYNPWKKPKKQEGKEVRPRNHDGKNFVIDYNLELNRTKSHTEQYEMEDLVVRRDNIVSLSFNCEGTLTQVKETVQVVLEYDDLGLTSGYMPAKTNDTLVVFDIQKCQKNPIELDNQKYQANAKWEDQILELDIFVPSNAIIGKYNVRVVVGKDSEAKGIDDEKFLWVVFNPYSKNDPCHLSDDQEIEEYLQNENGIVYTGASNYRTRWYPRKWWFGQFEPKILEAAMSFLLRDDRQEKRPNQGIPKLRNPWYVARVLSACIAEFCLQGNWSPPYEGGASPTSWNGSVKIITKALETGEAVKFGQCWVFSGVTTAICRALGIPCRSVTCFDSAHDTDETMTIDKYITKDNKHVDHLEADSVWNFHVWNELWMKRPDMGSKVDYDGWQVIDATPQEESFGRYQCGPAPVKAIKAGRIDCGFEAGFVFGEVNADTCYWLVSDESQFSARPIIERLAYQDPDNCGATISTKQVGSSGHRDVTNHYKFAEGTDQERESFNLAYTLGAGSKKFGDAISTKNSLKVSLAVEDDLEVGEDITISFNIESDADRNVTYVGGLYTCESADRAQRKELCSRHAVDEAVQVSQGSPLKISNEVKATEYFSKLENGNCMLYQVVVQDMDSNVCCMKEFKFVLAPKKIIDLTAIFSSDGSVKVGNELEFAVNITNAFESELTNCVMTFEGHGMGTDVENLGTFAPGETREVKFQLTPRKVGPVVILADLDSDQIQDIKASYDLNVVA